MTTYTLVETVTVLTTFTIEATDENDAIEQAYNSCDGWDIKDIFRSNHRYETIILIDAPVFQSGRESGS